MSTLHADLTAIRNARKLTLADVQSRTRLPEPLLRGIENGSIFEMAETQKTYLRSYVRSYAKAVRISDEDAVRALDEFFGGGYSGSLAQTYLGEAASADIAPDAEPDLPMLKRIVTSTVESEEFTRPDPTRPHNQATLPPPGLSDVNWSGMGRGMPVIKPPTGWMLIAIVLVAVVGVGLWLTDGFGLWGAEEVAASVSDTPVASAEAPPPVQAAPAPVEPMAETLELLVYAVFDRLEPIRVQTDYSEEINPYWVEYGTAMRFQFQNQISIRGAFPRFILMFNGHMIPDKESFLAGGNTLMIRREYLENTPLYRTAAPDSLPNGLPMPSRIVDRPVFRP
jgi:hypothetical protein